MAKETETIAPEAVIPLAAPGKPPRAFRGVMLLWGGLLWVVTLALVGFMLYTSFERNENRLLLERLDDVQDGLDNQPPQEGLTDIRRELEEIRDGLRERTEAREIEFLAGMAAMTLVLVFFGAAGYVMNIRLPKKYPELFERR